MKNKQTTTDDFIEKAIKRQNSWRDNRRAFTRPFLREFNSKHNKPVVEQKNTKKKKTSFLKSYWFPLLCVSIVICLILMIILFKINTPVRTIVPVIQEKVIEQPIKQPKINNENKVGPTFDLVRIEQQQNIVVAGRGVKNSVVSVLLNNKIVATEKTDVNGEFVYAPKHALNHGNYTLSLIDANRVKSEDVVFLYISDKGYKNSISLLMTKNGSTLLQTPELAHGDLLVSKIDYLDTGRIVVTGKGLPRLRVSLSLNDKYIGFARVSDYKNFGLGADVGNLISGDNYKLNIRLHDADGNTVANVEHKFVMPEMTGDDNTFYTVRRGDCLWIIARNFLHRGILFTIIADRNNIQNPDLIFPEQQLQIPSLKK